MNGKRMKILVVDDDQGHLVATKEILEMEGHEVVTHNSPFRTTELVTTCRPDLVILDINMPALSGETLCALVRGNSYRNDVPIYFYSSNDEDSLRKSVLRFGANGYVCKGDLAGLRRTVGGAAARV